METLSEAADKIANWSDQDWNRTVRDAFISGAEWMRARFSLHGTDACKTCEEGRSTLYAIFDGKCIKCANHPVLR